MANKPHTLIVRVSERQMRFLAETLLRQQRTKSQIIRAALNQYLLENYSKHGNSEPTQKQQRQTK